MALQLAKDRAEKEDAARKNKLAKQRADSERLTARANRVLKADKSGADAKREARRRAQEAAIERMKKEASLEAVYEMEQAGKKSKPAPPEQLPEVVGKGGVQNSVPLLVAQNTVETVVSGLSGEVAVPARVVKDTKTKAPPKNQVVITADTGFFDANASIALFEGEVFVDHPGFDLYSEKLEVFFESDDEVEGAETQGGSRKIRKAIATGKEVIVKKLNDKGKLQIGKCRKLIYDGRTEKVTLLIWPQVQQDDGVLIKADEKSTEIVFDKDGRMKTFGKATTSFGSGDAKGAEKQATGTP